MAGDKMGYIFISENEKTGVSQGKTFIWRENPVECPLLHIDVNGTKTHIQHVCRYIASLSTQKVRKMCIVDVFIKSFASIHFSFNSFLHAMF